jgi:hypothetical protein
MDEIIARMNRMELEMNALKSENESLKNQLSVTGAQSESTQTGASNAKGVKTARSHSVATSLISGMPTYHNLHSCYPVLMIPYLPF